MLNMERVMDRTTYNFSLCTTALMLGVTLAVWVTRMQHLHP